jgi:hypothetical protein
MDSKNDTNTESSDEKEGRKTISMGELSMLGKDVFDLRCVIKNVWSNRAVISKRLNTVSLIVSLLFTLVYTVYVVFSGVVGKLSLGWGIALYAVVGVFAVLVIISLIISVKGRSATTQTVHYYGRSLKITRYCIKIASLVMAVISIVLTSLTETVEPARLAVDTVFLILSVLIIIFQAIGLFGGGLGSLVKWLLSPVTVKTKFSVVVLEWYQLFTSGESTSVLFKKIDEKYTLAIQHCIDCHLMPVLGNKKITSISAGDIQHLLDNLTIEDRQIAEGTLKNIFEYAEECGYVIFNPCRDLGLTNTIEKEEKKTMKQKVAGFGLRVVGNVIAKKLSANQEGKENDKADKAARKREKQEAKEARQEAKRAARESKKKKGEDEVAVTIYDDSPYKK